MFNLIESEIVGCDGVTSRESAAFEEIADITTIMKLKKNIL